MTQLHLGIFGHPVTTAGHLEARVLPDAALFVDPRIPLDAQPAERYRSIPEGLDEDPAQQGIAYSQVVAHPDGYAEFFNAALNMLRAGLPFTPSAPISILIHGCRLRIDDDLPSNRLVFANERGVTLYGHYYTPIRQDDDIGQPEDDLYQHRVRFFLEHLKPPYAFVNRHSLDYLLSEAPARGEVVEAPAPVLIAAVTREEIVNVPHPSYQGFSPPGWTPEVEAVTPKVQSLWGRALRLLGVGR
jgi:hypothetical protein